MVAFCSVLEMGVNLLHLLKQVDGVGESKSNNCLSFSRVYLGLVRFELKIQFSVSPLQDVWRVVEKITWWLNYG